METVVISTIWRIASDGQTLFPPAVQRHPYARMKHSTTPARGAVLAALELRTPLNGLARGCIEGPLANVLLNQYTPCRSITFLWCQIAKARVTSERNQRRLLSHHIDQTRRYTSVGGYFCTPKSPEDSHNVSSIILPLIQSQAPRQAKNSPPSTWNNIMLYAYHRVEEFTWNE